MKTNRLNRKLYTASMIAAIFISSFSSLGSSQVFAQDNSLKLQPSSVMGVHQTGLNKTVAARSASPAPAALMPAASGLPTTVVHITNTSTSPGGWNPPPASPDPSGIDYWPLTGKLLVSDSEVDEVPFSGTMNVYQATTSGTLVSTCSTLSFSSEPSGVAINPINNHVFFSDDNGVSADRVFELSLGSDGTYCTADDSVVSTPVGTLYGATDAEDVAYGNNTVFIADGVNAEVYVVPLGGNSVLGGGDDGTVTHFDTATLGFNNVEGIGYNGDSGTLFIASALPNEKFLGEVTTAGVLLNTYDLSSAGLIHPEDVTYAPGSLNPAIKNIYLTDRGNDNNNFPNENDGRIFEINIGIPWVTSVLRASPNPTNASSVNYTVTFSEPVTGVDVTDFTLNTTGLSGAAVSTVTGSGTTYTVSVNTGTGTGTLRLDVTDNDSIIDSVGLKLGGIAAGNGNFTTGDVYTKYQSTPGSATLISPNGTIYTNQPTYTWNAVLEATWYYLWVSRPTGDPIKIWYQSANVCSAGTCSVTPATPLTAGAHTWWVQTWNEAGYGPWSAGMGFTPSVPGAATLSTPSGSIGANYNPTYTWNQVNGATWYYLWVDGPSGNLIKKWYTAAEAGCVSTSTCSVPSPASLVGGTYTWWIQTWSDLGYGPWSAGKAFNTTIPPLPGAATLVSPSGSILDTTPDYTWNQVNTSTWYYLWISKVNSNGSLTTIYTQWYPSAQACSGVTCTITPAGVTLTSGNYRWWVQTWNEGGYGPWSTGMDFSLP
jgi:hypothetical protein